MQRLFTHLLFIELVSQKRIQIFIFLDKIGLFYLVSKGLLINYNRHVAGSYETKASEVFLEVRLTTVCNKRLLFFISNEKS